MRKTVLAIAAFPILTLASAGVSAQDACAADGLVYNPVAKRCDDPPVSVPEPGTLLLLASGLIALGAARKLKK